MSTPQLRLVSETCDAPTVLKFEQRREPRHKIYARVTAVAHNPTFEDHSGALSGGAGQICALELTDQSASGLGAWSLAPVALGTRVTAFFPAHGAEPGHNRVGRVVRCEPADGGYRIGLRLEQQMAAA
jgi:hypothetical protein